MKTALISFVTVVAALACSCGTPRFLVGDGFIGSRGEKTILVPKAAADKTVLYDYVLRICDIDKAGAESNCKDTTVLANVISHSIY